jgi:hypothetical protein
MRKKGDKREMGLPGCTATKAGTTVEATLATGMLKWRSALAGAGAGAAAATGSGLAVAWLERRRVKSFRSIVTSSEAGSGKVVVSTGTGKTSNPEEGAAIEELEAKDGMGGRAPTGAATWPAGTAEVVKSASRLMGAATSGPPAVAPPLPLLPLPPGSPVEEGRFCAPDMMKDYLLGS